MESKKTLSELLAENSDNNERLAEEFWNSLSYDDKCNAFHAVVSRLFKGEIVDEGSYRHTLYEVFGFGPDMYSRGMDCGYMTLHNCINVEEGTRQLILDLNKE